jgi:hypothetical protein
VTDPPWAGLANSAARSTSGGLFQDVIVTPGIRPGRESDRSASCVGLSLGSGFLLLDFRIAGSLDGKHGDVARAAADSSSAPRAMG